MDWCTSSSKTNLLTKLATLINDWPKPNYCAIFVFFFANDEQGEYLPSFPLSFSEGTSSVIREKEILKVGNDYVFKMLSEVMGCETAGDSF
jgi:hypothetical protein